VHTVISKTFGGLPRQYYFRHLIFSLCMAGLWFFAHTRGGASIPTGWQIIIVVNTLLYPYTRFLFESAVRFHMGDKRFYVPAGIMLFVKVAAMMICWFLALSWASVALWFLYILHSKNEGEQPQD